MERKLQYKQLGLTIAYYRKLKGMNHHEKTSINSKLIQS